MEIIKIYVGTYAKYNNGDLTGKWLNLSDYSNLDEFFAACREIHSDEEDPELMFQDFEAPEELEEYISESYISEDIFKAIEALEEMESDPIAAWNEYSKDDQIYEFNEEFFTIFFANDPMSAARATYFGDVNWTHDYITFDGYGNLKSLSDPEEIINKDELLKWMIER